VAEPISNRGGIAECQPLPNSIYQVCRYVSYFWLSAFRLPGRCHCPPAEHSKDTKPQLFNLIKCNSGDFAMTRQNSIMALKSTIFPKSLQADKSMRGFKT
jgi:hypothetical protein